MNELPAINLCVEAECGMVGMMGAMFLDMFNNTPMLVVLVGIGVLWLGMNVSSIFTGVMLFGPTPPNYARHYPKPPPLPGDEL